MTVMSTSTNSESLCVVLPTANAWRHRSLFQALDSIHRHLLPGDSLDILVVLDGEDPADYAFLDDLDHPVRVISQPQAGPAAARNLGWRSTDADVIIFIDDDIIVDAEWLSDLRAYLRDHPEVHAFGGGVRPLHDRNVVSRMITDQVHIQHQPGDHGWRLITANAVVRREALEAVGGFDEHFRLAAGEDFDLCDRMGAAGFVVTATDDMVVYHHHPVSIHEMRTRARRYRIGNWQRDEAVNLEQGVRPMANAEEAIAAHRDALHQAVTAAPSAPRPPLPSRLLRLARRTKHELSLTVVHSVQPSRNLLRKVVGKIRRTLSSRYRVANRHLTRRLRSTDLVPTTVVERIEMVTYAIPETVRIPHWYEQARNSPARPGRIMALAEAVLELIWNVETQRPMPAEPFPKGPKRELWHRIRALFA